jgi:hypothetical protein
VLPADPEDVLDPHPPRTSNFRLEITLSVGYQRERAGIATTGKWEATATSVLLLIGGIALVLLFVYMVLLRF